MKIIKNKIEEFDVKIDLIDCTVFNKIRKSDENKQKLSKTKDAFEEIHEKIAQTNSEIKKLAQLQKFEAQLRLDSINEINGQIKKFIKLSDDLRSKHMLIMKDFYDIEKHIKGIQKQINLNITTSTVKLTNLIEALDGKQSTIDALCLKNSTKMDYHEIQIEKVREDHQRLLEK